MRTERLLLRERTEERLQEVLNMDLDQQLEFFGFNKPEPLQKQLDYIRKGYRNYRMSVKLWDLLLPESNKVIGSAGYHSWYQAHDRAELGYTIHEPYRSKGYMREALKAIIIHGFVEMGLNRLEGFVAPQNTASLKLMNHFGIQKEGYFIEHYRDGDELHDSIAFSLLKRDFDHRI
jgi:ribosomal-protein-alanine N-acetyltransferase